MTCKLNPFAQNEVRPSSAEARLVPRSKNAPKTGDNARFESKNDVFRQLGRVYRRAMAGPTWLGVAPSHLLEMSIFAQKTAIFGVETSIILGFWGIF